MATNTGSFESLKDNLAIWGQELGFQQIGVSDTEISQHKTWFREWLDKGYHGSMQWMEEHAELRESPEKLVPGTLRVISARMDYLPQDTHQIKILKSPTKAYISRYTLGRDYHKLIRKRLAKLATKIETYCKEHNLLVDIDQRPFVDSAPVLERPYAQKAGLGSMGKHTLIINRNAGSWFFLGEILTNIPIPVDTPSQEDLCGSCEACLKVCPTDAFPKPFELDARRCISYLTIEHKGSIPEEFREAMGNRVFGCDDCQAICPWNKYAKFTREEDFTPRHQLDDSELLILFNWSEDEFLQKTAGSAIRRIGYTSWLRNLAIGLGNAPPSVEILHALEYRLTQADEMLREHLLWAINRQKNPHLKRKRKIKRDSKS